MTPRPRPITLEGRSVRLEPLAQAHAAELFDSTCGPENDRLWLYLAEGPFRDRAAFEASVAAKVASLDPLFFAIVDRETNRAAGRAALMRIEPAHRVVEVGHILYAPAFHWTRGATEAMYLLARYVFEDLRYRRYEWKCDSRNAASRRAAERLGFTFEGIFRQHMLVKGVNRDTAWYSMLDGEWPDRRARLERWLAPENFDGEGWQRERLSR